MRSSCGSSTSEKKSWVFCWPNITFVPTERTKIVATSHVFWLNCTKNIFGAGTSLDLEAALQRGTMIANYGNASHHGC